MELNGTYQLLAYSDIVNTEALVEAGREVGLGLNAEGTKYVVMSCHQNSNAKSDY
jgi:hypothetical protein